MTSETAITWAHAGIEPLADELVERAVRTALAHGGRAGTVLSVVFVDDATLTGMHAEHLDDPSPTDVLTFDLGKEGEGPAGELYVSVDCAVEVSRRRGVPLERELCLYVVHGVLHLCGFDDGSAEDRARMRAAERTVLLELGFAPDDAPHDVER